MEPINLDRAVASTGLAIPYQPLRHLSLTVTVSCLLFGAVICWHLFRDKTGSKPTSSPSTSAPAASTEGGVRLTEIDLGRDETNTDLDIIAVHGLDTTSEVTWTWKDGKDPRNKEKWVNWLEAPDMLPSVDQHARIYTCDWPAPLLEPSGLVQMSVQEYIHLLLDGVQRALFGDGTARDEDRPILFIASCLGGLILAKALVKADEKGSDYHRLRRATRGIVFLATPFRGTSFQDVATWALLGLNIRASVRRQAVSSLLDSCKGSTADLRELVRRLTKICQDEEKPLEIFNFYERASTSLPHKVFPWLPACFGQNKPLVDAESASLDITEPLPLDRRHSVMNKFPGTDCADYQKVAGQISRITIRIRAGTPLEQADAWMRTTCYSEERLQIERLSGETLQMAQCYINLAVIQRQRDQNEPSENSPFSLFARLNVETPDETAQVDLAAIFDDRQGRIIRPRRILIRGSAGVGKTTLCKRMVHDFTHDVKSGLHRSWNKLYDRLIWIPLRRLKTTLDRPDRCNFEDVFYDLYFSDKEPDRGRYLARQLWRNLDRRGRDRTLFILDGADEIADDLHGCNNKSEFLQNLFKKDNVIITSRPYFTMPVLRDVDLELETVGFFPDQVKEYVKTTFNDQAITSDIENFLNTHSLVEGLMRIPIQLDALCLAWENLDSETVLDTMTSIYRVITQRLWTKDFKVMSKRNLPGIPGTVSGVGVSDVHRFVNPEIKLLEDVAFTGLINNVIEFSPTHQRKMMDQFPYKREGSEMPISMAFPCLSFLRSSDKSKSQHDLSFHFLHLTFQEFFAAQYFVRHWKSRAQMTCLNLSENEMKQMTPVEFLQKEKYSARYDVFWRFVAGLLVPDGCGQDQELLDFFQAVEQPPLDMLGPTHQRLVMHCLSEVSMEKETVRRRLEDEFGLQGKLKQWHLFECSVGVPILVKEMEFPTQVLCEIFRENPDNVDWRSTLYALSRKPAIPPMIYEEIILWLEDSTSSDSKCEALEALAILDAGLTENITMTVVRRLDDPDERVQEEALDVLATQTSLSDEILTAVIRCLDNGNEHLHFAAVNVFGRQERLSAEISRLIVQRLNDHGSGVRAAAVEALGKQPNLSDETMGTIALRLCDESSNVRKVAIKALGKQPKLLDEMMGTIALRLGDESSDVRKVAIKALGKQPKLSDEIIGTIVLRLGDESSYVRKVAIKALGKQPKLSDEMMGTIALRLGDESSNIRKVAIEALGKQPKLLDEIIGTIALRLCDESSNVRKVAIKALGKQPKLSDEIIGTIALRLYDESFYIREVAIEALGKQPKVSDEMIGIIALRLGDESSIIRKVAIQALEKQPSLSNEILMAVAERLGDKGSYIRIAATGALRKQVKRSDETLTVVTQQLQHDDIRVQHSAAEILLERQHDDALAAIRRLLKDEQPARRRFALRVLKEQPSLSDDCVIAIAQRLDDADLFVRLEAMNICRKQEKLSGEALDSIARHLWGKEEMSVRTEATIKRGLQRAIGDNMSSIAQLLDSFDKFDKWTAFYYLEEDDDLSGETLAALTQRLDALTQRLERGDDLAREENSRVLKVLEKQRFISDETLTSVTRQLGHENFDVIMRAETVLRKHKSFYSALLGGSCAGQLYRALFEWAQDSQFSWYVEGNRSVLNTPEGVMSAKMDDMEGFEASISEAMQTLRRALTDQSLRWERMITSISFVFETLESRIRGAG
ncbi:hypothetical protein L249_7674 [Ophiocordyceps polyrhachis-furcata BCC 54312]|uniref:NACHT domain-containing protein n=1 Tax=Ophiocordyceps polyrhachis-furcata BCC 54312 TaxID=1330021 RepID=A0A367LBZ3_9HYPO|nr:hypothetical protein L249_7674 [Ophiocordyceps polyrhachis-furcata BCC 54312]